MELRIRYIKHPNIKNALISNNSYYSPKNKAIYQVVLYLDKCEYAIVNTKTGNRYKNKRKITNLNALKRSAKVRLERLGVVFGKEDRDRTFGRCDKGYSQDKHEKQNELLSPITAEQ